MNLYTKSTWVYLIIAGILEIMWPITLKYSDNFTKFIPTIATIVISIGSYFFFSLSIRHLPVGIGYTILVSIGITGLLIVDILLFGKQINSWLLIYTSLIIVGIVGLQCCANSVRS